MAIIKALPLVLMLLGGCAAPLLPKLPLDHPANPDAVAARLPLDSAVLKNDGPDVQERPAASKPQDHQGMKCGGGMKHGGHH